MNVSIEKKKEEAIKRMRELNLFDYYIKEFERYGKIQVSEPPYGALYYLDEEDDKELIEYIKDFENDGENFAYLVVRTYFNELGVMDSIFYVSDFIEEWEYDWEDMKSGIQVVNVFNHDCKWCSEIGSIGFKKTVAGGILRTA